MELEFKKLDITDVDEIFDLQEKVNQALIRKEMFIPWGKENYIEAIKNTSDNYGVFFKKRLVGYNMIFYPWDIEYKDNLGYDVGLPESEKELISHFEYIFVDPEFAGKGIGKIFGEKAREKKYFSREIKYIAGTVHPDNIASLKILLKSGMSIMDLKLKYGGKERYILFSRLGQDIKCENGIKVRLDNKDKQKKLLLEGYIGGNIFQEEGILYLTFVKKPLHLNFKQNKKYNKEL